MGPQRRLIKEALQAAWGSCYPHICLSWQAKPDRLSLEWAGGPTTVDALTVAVDAACAALDTLPSPDSEDPLAIAIEHGKPGVTKAKAIGEMFVARRSLTLDELTMLVLRLEAV